MSRVTGSHLEKKHVRAATLVALFFLPSAVPGLPAQEVGAGSNSQAQQPVLTSGQPPPAKTTLPRVTIEAEKEHTLRLKVDRFVTSVAIQPWGDTLYRWTKPVCPLVAGLPKAQGEFVLARISKAANDARAPLAGRVCSPNLFVVVINDDPSRLLKAWWRRDRRMYNLHTVGMEAVKRFIYSKRPIRVWYNTYEGCANGIAATESIVRIFAGMGQAGAGPVGCKDGDLGSRIVSLSTGSDVSSAIIVVDGRHMKNANLGQVADYIALIGLADGRLETDSVPVPSILELFANGTPPQGLTQWDRALLYSLYNTNHRSRLEVPEMEVTMVRRIMP